MIFIWARFLLLVGLSTASLLILAVLLTRADIAYRRRRNPPPPADWRDLENVDSV